MTDRSIESTHDRARIERRMTHVCDALAPEPVLCAAEEKA